MCLLFILRLANANSQNRLTLGAGTELNPDIRIFIIALTVPREFSRVRQHPQEPKETLAVFSSRL